MKEIKINVDSYNSDSINTIQGNNNAEVYKIYVLFNKRRIDLTGKTVKMAYLRTGTVEGDVINLNITNATEGEITLQITNKISKKDGVYSCQLAIYGADGFLEHTATFGLTVEANIFTKIAGEIADSKDFTYLENILDKASKLSEKLKENTATATNANSNLESNITEANNINSKLLENTSTATSLNKNLESNIDLAKEVKETIKDLDTKNIEATEKIERLEGLNAKAEELSNNINEALPVKDALVKNTEEAKAANTNLLAANQEAASKNTELQASLEKTKEFIEGLDGSQNIPQLRLDVTELQNGLKSNQALGYEGSSISADNTLEGRTEGMRIGGRTLVNLVNIRKMILGDNSKEIAFENDIIKFKKAYPNEITYLKVPFLSKPNTTYTIVYDVIKNNVEQPDESKYIIYPDGVYGDFNSTMNTFPQNGQTGLNKFCLNTKSTLFGTFSLGFHRVNVGAEIWIKNLMILEGDWTNKEIPDFFEGIKSFGETEKVGDKYKISILSNGKNLFNDKIKLYNGTDKGNSAISFAKEGEYYIYEIPNSYNQALLHYDIKLPNENFKLIGEFEILSENIWKPISTPLTRFKENRPYLQFIDNWKSITKVRGKNIMLIYSKDNELYEPYKCDKKDILIKEPLRSKSDICDLLYEDNGQVKIDRYVGIRKYQEGDENNKEVITDKINTVYVLDKPTTEIVENCVDIDLDTFGEKTYFSIENSLPGTLDFKVPSNIASIVQNTAREVNNIWDVINNLLVPSIVKANGNLAMLKLNNNLN
ncbi:BppU family phage baseplate upper protein [Clostridium perfringens]|uniref:BppU family phage baseplate upper protein n=1 Tax=Clostridium perfringens TaxID=1502 RepID=UPI003D32FC2E